MPKDKKIVKIPQIKRTYWSLEKEIDELIDAGSYEVALDKIAEALDRVELPGTLYLRKLLCLQHLERYREVEDLADQLLRFADDGNYFQYLTFYLDSLAKQGLNPLVYERIQEELEKDHFTAAEKAQLLERQKATEKMLAEKSSKILDTLKMATLTNNQEKQWLSFHKWKRYKQDPPTFYLELIANESVHPILKTEMIEAFINMDVYTDVTIRKFDRTLTVSLQKLPKLKEHPTYQTIEKHLQKLQDSNVTLATYMAELFERYSKVYYPFFFPKKDTFTFLAALQYVALQLYGEEAELDMERTEQVNTYIKEIENSNQIYLALVYL